MNRLWVRLTLAFVAVTLVGVTTIAWLTDWSAGTEFRQYLARQDVLAQSGVVDDLEVYYAQNGNWNGVGQILGTATPGNGRGMGAGRGRPAVMLADAGGTIVYDERGARTSGTLTSEEKSSAIPITAGGRTVGYLLTVAGMGGRGAMQPAEQSFLDDLRRTLIIAALLAGGLGLGLGLVMSRMIAAPLANLAQAVHAFAAREWDRRVPVTGATEIAEVAREFNEMAQTIQTAESLRRNLMADVAHELRTPLTVLQGNLQALLDGVYPLEPSEIVTLYDQTRVLNHLVDDLRELALADAGQLPLALRETDVAEVCRTAVEQFQPVAESQGVHLGGTLIGPLPVHTDPDRVGQVLRNLVANALQHTPEAGSITVSAQIAAPEVLRIEVADTGAGISAEDLPHVFDRFYRGDKARTHASGSRGGTGLGLAIAKAWVEALGGTIGVTSTAGQGSRFWFTLPCTHA